MTLTPDGYQFPYDGPPTAGRDSDANWLLIQGTVSRATGEAFTFRDPCLLTMEALELGRWFKEAVLGLIEPSPRPDEEEAMLTFLEQNLAFSVESSDHDFVILRVHLSLEASPLWAEQGVDLFDTFQRLRLPASDLQQAAEEWLAEVATFPLR